MADGVLRQVPAAEAVRLAASVAGKLLPATLDARYVIADAVRDPALLQPTFLCFESAGDCWLHGVHIAQVPGTRWRDASSPYGYGGPIASTADDAFIETAWSAYTGWMRQEGVVVEYVRFHPILSNERAYRGHVLANREVVSVDLSVDDVAAGYAPRLRQTLKKAQKSGLRYEERPLRSVHAEFARFHRRAMHEMQADAFYLFTDSYFEALSVVPGAMVGFCVANDGGEEWLAAALFLDGRGVREYHLAATNAAGRRAGASSFTLHEGALQARRLGLSQLYLGGGTSAAPDNPLFFFKAGFSDARLTYRTGWTVFDEAGYEELRTAFPARVASPPRAAHLPPQSLIMTWDPVWETVYRTRAWGQYPGEDVIRFVKGCVGAVADRSQVKLLEVGSGAGANLWFMAREGFCTHGVEGSATAVRLTEERLDRECPQWRGVGGQVAVGDLSALPYPDGFFDAVLDVVAICYCDFETAARAYAELARVTRPGGKLFSRTFARGCWGDGTGTAAGPGMWVCAEGPLQGLGATRFTDEDEVAQLLRGWRVDRVERTSQTEGDRAHQIRHLLMYGSKPRDSEGLQA